MKALIIGAVVLVIVVVFVNQAGLLKKISFSNLLSPTTDFYGGVDLSGAGTSSVFSYGSTTLKGTANPAPIIGDIPKGFRAKDLSPYFKQVSISSAAPRRDDANYDLISVSGNSILSASGLSLSGWYMRSNTGTVYLPKAVTTYDPAAYQTPKSVVMKNGQTLNIYSSVSPLGISFRANKCSGYLNNRYQFNPPIEANCPIIDRQDFANLAGQCQEYVLSLNNCAAPDFGDPAITSDASCRVFLNSLDYPGCFLRHHNDTDFLLSEWNLWLGRSFIDPLHDRVLLFDSKGLLVDQFIY